MKRKVSILIIPHSEHRTRRITFAWRTIWVGLGALIIVLLAAGFFIYNAARISYRVAQLDYLVARNQELEARSKQIDELSNMLGAISQEGNKVKQMLGMEKTPPPVDLTSLVFEYKPVRASQIKISEEGAPFYFESPPTEGFIVSRGFSPDHPALDFAAPLGSPVFAPARGWVSSVSWDSIYGNCIVIAHSQELETFYGHLERVLVAEGDSVNSRDLVGFVGSTGRSSGPHLHFEVRYRGNRLDPAGLFFLK